jgi:hypothetical protein
LENFAMRIYPKPRVDPVLVDPDSAASLLAVERADIDHLIAVGDLPTKVIGGKTLIPYRALLILAGVARWKFQEIVDA